MNKRTSLSLTALAAAIVAASPAHAVDLLLTFDVDTPNLAQTIATYGFAGGNVVGAYAASGQLFLNAGGGQSQLDLGAFSGDLNIQYDTTISGTPGSVNTAFRVGDNHIVFHPGYGGGAFRIDGVFDNTSMGFTPPVAPMSHVSLSITEGGLVTIAITNGDTFNYVWQDMNYVAGTTVLGLSVGGSGMAVFDNVQVSSVPEPATWGMLVVGLLAFAGLARRSRG